MFENALATKKNILEGLKNHLRNVHTLTNTAYLITHAHTHTQITSAYQLWYRVSLVVMLKAQPLGCMLNRYGVEHARD